MERPFAAYVGDEAYFFVSYSHQDSAIVYPEMVWLREAGINLWYDEGIHIGSVWRQALAQALDDSYGLIYLCTAQASQSDNCLKEINFALDRDKPVFVVQLDDSPMPVHLQLSLSDRQALVRSAFDEATYRARLTAGLKMAVAQSVPGANLSDQAEPLPTPKKPPTAEAKSNGKSIAILPLVNRSNDPENEHLCDGIAEELVNGLSQLSNLRVASQMASFVYKNQHVELQVMGAKLGVGTILSGSVQKSGTRLRINLRLDDVQTGDTLWSQRFDRELADIFALQDDITRKVINALKVELNASEQELWSI
jgi:TolB-like protein